MMMTMMCALNWRARKGGRDFRAAPLPPPPKKIKKHKLCAPNNIKRFLRLTRQPKSATEIG
jgi:hypothetical protein